MRSLIRLALLASTISMFGLSVAAQADMLKGEVNELGAGTQATDKSRPLEPMPSPVLAPSKPMTAGTKQDQLKGNADDDGDVSLSDMKASADSPNVLKGNASLQDTGLHNEDPDVDDQELMVQWDKWRNRLLWSIQSGVQESLNNPDDSMLRWDPRSQAIVPRFPLGTTAWFSCQVTPDKHIVNLKILHSSGFPNFDEAVRKAVTNLEGTSILKYPSRSRRRIVSQVAGIKTSNQDERQFFKFGDTERYRSQ